MDNKNGDGVTIIMNTEGVRRGMKIRVDSTGVAMSASHLLALGFATPISASSSEHKAPRATCQETIARNLTW